MKLRLLCTDVNSESAGRLSEGLSRLLDYKVYKSDKVIPNRQHIRYGDQRDKLTQYKFFRKHGLNFPWFTESKEEAAEYMDDNAQAILCRTLIQGQEGHGIVIADEPKQLMDAKVYVAYENKDIEYRVNILSTINGDSIINIREKRRKNGFVPPEDGDHRIRNIVNGYVYCIPKRPVPPEVIQTAIEASYVTDSNIIGVDVAYDSVTKNHFLLEVNSAPSLEGITVDMYAQKIIEEFNND